MKTTTTHGQSGAPRHPVHEVLRERDLTGPIGRTIARCRGLASILLAALLVSIPRLEAQEIAQTITLQPGWNAISLDVQPTNNSPASVFANLPLGSAWTPLEPLTTVDFVQDETEITADRTGWLVWFPPDRPESVANNLSALFAHRLYLLKLTNTTAVTWTVTGRPSPPTTTWVADRYNFRSFPVDPATPPTFKNFLQSSPAHYVAASNRIQNIYRLGTNGTWALVGNNDSMRSGEALWVYCNGGSDFTSPLSVDVDLGDALDFGTTATELKLRFLNRTTGARTATIQTLGNAGTGSLVYYRFEATNALRWFNLPSPHTVSTAAGATEELRLSVRRLAFPEAQLSAILEIKDGQGTRMLVPVTATRPAGGYTGLWVGNATIDAVSAVHSGELISVSNRYETVLTTNVETGVVTSEQQPLFLARTNVSSTPVPSAAQFTFRLLVHVDSNGAPRLLKEVIQMWRTGAYTNDAHGYLRVSNPGDYALITDDEKLASFSGARLVNGQAVGRRLSSVGFDFPRSPDGNSLPLDGQFGIGQLLTGTIRLSSDFPTNPFRHRYHPDHDGKSADLNSTRVEVYPVTRALELYFAPTDPGGGPPVADYGQTVIGGTYQETVTGLHRNPIVASGTFRLTRVATTGILNQ